MVSRTASPFQTRMATLLSLSAVQSPRLFQRFLQMMNQRGLVQSPFSAVLNDLNKAAEELMEQGVVYEEAFAQACGTEIINEESLSLALSTLMENVLRLKGKLDVETLVQTSKEHRLDLSPSDCRELLQHFAVKRRAAHRQ